MRTKLRMICRQGVFLFPAIYGAGLGSLWLALIVLGRFVGEDSLLGLSAILLLIILIFWPVGVANVVVIPLFGMDAADTVYDVVSTPFLVLFNLAFWSFLGWVLDRKGGAIEGGGTDRGDLGP